MSTHSETVTRPEFQHPASIVPGVVPGTILESHEPKGVPTKEMWQYHKDHMELVSPLNRRKFKVLVVGTGLAAGAAAAALGELGYTVKAFTYHDAPRRAHSIAAQGGVNSARGKKVDNDGAYRHVKDTVKGGDYRCRESDCWRSVRSGIWRCTSYPLFRRCAGVSYLLHPWTNWPTVAAVYSISPATPNPLGNCGNLHSQRNGGFDYHRN